jgi:hypothetical protein
MDDIPEAARPQATVRQSGEWVKPALTISEAARACGVNRRIIRRHRQVGDFPGAFRDEDSVWRIPIEDLRLVGLPADLTRKTEETLEEASEGSPEEPLGDIRVERLRTEVAVLRERLRAAELIAMEREKRVEDLRLILRLLPPPSPLPQPSRSQFTRARGAAPFAPASAEVETGLLSPQALSMPGSQHVSVSTRSEGLEQDLSESRRTVGAQTIVGGEPILHLPDPLDTPAGQVEEPGRSAEGEPESNWAPEDHPSHEAEAELLHHQTPRFFGAPLDVPVRRNRRWLPWRRSRE